MATQLTLITMPAITDIDDAATDDGSELADPVLPARRSAARTGWLDRQTIIAGRRGVARARAALADAARRAAVAEAEKTSARGAELAREADRFAGRTGSQGHAA